MYARKLAIEIDNPRFKNELIGEEKRMNKGNRDSPSTNVTFRRDALSKWRKGGRLTIGAKITSSYALNPYFSAGAPGRRTMKSYRFNATSLFK